MMDRKMVNFIKEQYPPGTRIRLNAMDDPYAPILPGTEGEVDFVDDEGQIFMKWDNGRTLPLAPGEDSFTVLPPKLTTLKLYMPLTADLYEQNEYGEFDDITSSSFPSAVSVCTSAATSGICWKSTLPLIRKSCLAQRVVADGSNRRYDRQSRGNSPFQREAPQRDRLGAGRCSLARHPPDRRDVLHRHRRCGSQQPGGSRSLLWNELFVRGAYGIPFSY